ncbi:MAG: hypothetical protein GC159_01770 [Phycisphaera sp.]|nr:hypothetical protein [Phycisphaera sp.]
MWLGCLLLATAGAAHAQQVAVTFEDKAVLTVPVDLREQVGKAFDVADTPPTIDFIRIAGLLNKSKDTLWSSWGDGCVAADGCYYTSIGDHLGVDATAYVYEYNPKTRTLTRVVDVAEAIGQKPGVYGHGKIHSAISQEDDGSLWFSTYWGKHREVDAAFGKNGYEGSILLRMDPATHKVENVGAIVPRQGLPASHHVPERHLLCFYSVYENNLVVYDLKQRKRLFLGGADVIAGNREMMHDKRGRVYFTGQDNRLHYYDPETNTIKATKASVADLPTAAARDKSVVLRAAINKPTPDGMLYAMTASGRLFAFDPEAETVKDLGPNFANGMYTAVMVADPTGKYLYYTPGAHGSAVKVGAPVIRYEIATGKKTVLAFLEDVLHTRFTYQLGGTYNLQLSPDGKRLYITFNGAAYDPSAAKVLTFGEPSVVVLHLD